MIHMAAPTVRCRYHVLSQMWFIELYKSPLDYVLHVENLADEFEEMQKVLPVVRKTPSLSSMPHKNVREGQASAKFDAEWLKTQPLAQDALRKVVGDYLKQDYACLGYPVPTFRHL